MVAATTAASIDVASEESISESAAPPESKESKFRVAAEDAPVPVE